MRSLILFNLIILITGTISTSIGDGKHELTQFKLTFTEAVSLNNIQSVSFVARLNNDEPTFYCDSFFAQGTYEARDKRRASIFGKLIYYISLYCFITEKYIDVLTAFCANQSIFR